PGSSGYLLPRGVGPQPFEIVEGSGLGEEQVSDDFPKVKQHPTSGFLSFDAQRAHLSFAELLLQVLRHRRDLALRFARGDDEKIGVGSFLTHVEDENVRRLLVEEQRGDLMRQLAAGLLFRQLRERRLLLRPGGMLAPKGASRGPFPRVCRRHRPRGCWRASLIVASASVQRTRGRSR